MVYDNEFVPEMRLLGHDWRTSDREGGSIGSTSTWYEGKAAALQQLATERIGPDAKPFKFVSRKQHSAYVCDCPHMSRPTLHPYVPTHTLMPHVWCHFVCLAEGVSHLSKVEAGSGGGNTAQNESNRDTQ